MKEDRSNKIEALYRECVYYGILSRIMLEIDNDGEELTEELTALAERYEAEYGNQDGSACSELREALEAYREGGGKEMKVMIEEFRLVYYLRELKRYRAMSCQELAEECEMTGRELLIEDGDITGLTLWV